MNENEQLIETAAGLLDLDFTEWDSNPEYTRAICELVALLGNYENKAAAWRALAIWNTEHSPFRAEAPAYLGS